MNTLRMPAAQTLLLFAHTIDTNETCSRCVCDSWLCIDFPVPESGMQVLLKASNLRRAWSRLLSEKLDCKFGNLQTINDTLRSPNDSPTNAALKVNVENALQNASKSAVAATRRHEAELWHDLAAFMNTDVVYTLKRLLPADLKTMYVRGDGDALHCDPNPFAPAGDFASVPNETKGGVHVTETICYGCVQETEWSVALAAEIVEQRWECGVCRQTFNLTALQKLQHKMVCVRVEVREAEPSEEEQRARAKSERPANAKEFRCAVCKKTLFLSSVDILRHRKACK